MSINLETLTITSAHKALAAGEFTVRELTDAYLAAIEQKNDELHVYLSLHTDIDQQVELAQEMFATWRFLRGVSCCCGC